jgi:predicted dehydrogenase
MIDRLLLVGYGSIGRRHLRIAREALPDADIRVLRHRSTTEALEYSNGCFSQLEEALAFKPQAAIIASPAPFHLTTVRALAGIGCHMLVEKPLADNLLEVKNLVSLVNERQCVLQVGYNLRFLPSLREFRTRIATGAIGRVLSVRCEIGQYLPSWRPDSDYRETVSAQKKLGGGVLLELSHELDYLRWVFGEVAWVNACLRQQSALVIDVEDTAHLILGFTSESSSNAPVATLNMDFIRHDTTRICTAIGETGSLRWNGVTGVVDECPARRNKWSKVFHHPHQRDDSYRSQWDHFLACISSGLPPLINVHDGLAALAIIDAARRSSMAQGERVIVSHNLIGTEE